MAYPSLSTQPIQYTTICQESQELYSGLGKFRATRTCKGIPPTITGYSGWPPDENPVKRWDIVGNGGWKW